MPVVHSIDGRPYPLADSPVQPIGGDFADVLARRLPPDADWARGRSAPPPGRKPSPYAATEEPARPRAVVTAEQIMTQAPDCIPLDLAMDEADRRMRHRRFRHLPVVTADGKLAGILSDRDALAFRGEPGTPVSRCMSSRVLTATRETPVREIAEVLIRHRVGALPIVDDEHRVVGILTTSDLLRAIARHAPIDLWA